MVWRTFIGVILFLSFNTIGFSKNRTTGHSWLPSCFQVSQLGIDSQTINKPVVVDSNKIAMYSYHFILYYDFYTTVTALHNYQLTNLSEPNNAYLYYNLDVKSTFKLFKTTWEFYLFNDYGLRHYFDSITIKTQDLFTLKNSIQYPIWKNQVQLSLQSNTQTTLFNTKKIREGSNGETERYLYESYMSPGTITYSGGISYQFKTDGSLHLGLGSSKVTKIKRQSIFDSRQMETISGLNKGQRKKSEFGIVITTTIPVKQLGKRWYWESYCNFFSPMNKLMQPRYYTLDLNNVIHLTLLKYVRLSWRGKLQYHPEESPEIGIINQLSLGFYLNNHL